MILTRQRHPDDGKAYIGTRARTDGEPVRVRYYEETASVVRRESIRLEGAEKARAALTRSGRRPVDASGVRCSRRMSIRGQRRKVARKRGAE